MTNPTNPLSAFVVPNSDPTHYTPSTTDVRDSYRFSNKRPDICGKDFGAEFDRFVAYIRAAALDEAAEDRSLRLKGHSGVSIRALRARASTIRALKEEK